MQYTRELARIKATQYRQRIARYGRQAVRIPEPVTFERWFLLGIRRYEKKGAEFEFLAPGLVKIIWPGKPAVLRTVADFEREYQKDYLSRFLITSFPESLICCAPIMRLD